MTQASLRALLRCPVIVAPMGGGPSRPELVIAAADAGAVGFLAGGYKTAAAMKAEMAAVRARTTEPFGVNVFVPGAPSTDRDAIARYLASLGPDASLGEPTWDDDDFEAKIGALLHAPPAVVSFTFGCPSAELVAAFRDAGAIVAVTVTSPEEAAMAASAGADALCVQGSEAGAHQGTFSNDDGPGREVALMSLIDAVARVTDLPQIAAGGIMHADQVGAVLAAGALAAQCGTAFLRCPESGANELHKAALADPRYTTTALTRAFSGRWARGLVNQFILDHRDAPAAYPEINNATRPLRSAAALRRDPEAISLWAGEGYRAARDRPAAEVIEWLGAPGRHRSS